MSTLYLNLMGYTGRRPANYPTLDRAALMRNAHRIARSFRARFTTYREALAYGLATAWRQNRSARTIQVLALQVAPPSVPIAPVAATSTPQSMRSRPMLGSYGYVGA
jgi:hypothetical protein